MSDERIQWEWGYYGKCYINGKFSHAVRIDTNNQCSVWTDCPEPSGRLLDATDCKSLQDAIDKCEKESINLVKKGFNSLQEKKKTLNEYPFHTWRNKK